MAEIFQLIDGGLKNEDLEFLARILNQKELLIFPTETFYGLGGLAIFPDVYQKIFQLKGRHEGKPLPFCASDLEMVLSSIQEPPVSFFQLARAFWPGPLTLVLKARSGLLPQSFHGPEQTIAVRVPSPDWLRQLIKKAGALLISTSANASGYQPLSSFDEVFRVFADRLPFFIDGGQTPGEKPSTIIDLTGSKPVGQREGKIPFEEIWPVLYED
ncbi:MAG: L-threonylcarbamoyladenylate synthase [Acidobacteriota bacterium]|nr:L-threonylcarbamoyladenylate synthase [Acidobacteriota bacterium]